jgi:hypothetical protein
MILDGLHILFYKNYRYVAFDNLGRKLITGIANTPVITQSWERGPIGMLRTDLM